MGASALLNERVTYATMTHAYQVPYSNQSVTETQGYILAVLSLTPFSSAVVSFTVFVIRLSMFFRHFTVYPHRRLPRIACVRRVPAVSSPTLPHNFQTLAVHAEKMPTRPSYCQK